MSFKLAGKAHFPMNTRWCAACAQWRDTKGGQFRPFVCAACKAKRKPT